MFLYSLAEYSELPARRKGFAVAVQSRFDESPLRGLQNPYISGSVSFYKWNEGLTQGRKFISDMGETETNENGVCEVSSETWQDILQMHLPGMRV